MTNDIAVRVHKGSVVQDSIYGKRVRGLDVFLTVIIYTCAGFSILLLAGIMGYVFVRGIPHVTWAFLSTASSATKGTFGILGNIINTLYIVIITLLIATPLGIGSAVYLNEYAKPGKVVRMIEFTTETLSGIPSIIFGLFGMVFFGNALGLGYSILTGALTLTIMILPLITRTTQEALKTVPLPPWSPWNRSHKMVYDTDYPASQRHAGNPYRRNPGYRKNCGRVSSPAVHGGKRLLSSKESVFQDI